MNTQLNLTVFNEFPVLETPSLRLRAFGLNDTSALFAIRSHSKVMEYMDTDPMVRQSAAYMMIARMQVDFESQEAIHWVIEEKKSKKMIGYFSYWRLDKKHCRAEIGYALHPDYWNQRYMTETLLEVLQFGFQQLQLHSIEANVNPNNRPSIKLLQKIGFQQEAHFRSNYFYNNRYIDSLIYCLLETDPIYEMESIR
jgi:ribosomal-protein-alanine N-acetyltransferase